MTLSESMSNEFDNPLPSTSSLLTTEIPNQTTEDGVLVDLENDFGIGTFSRSYTLKVSYVTLGLFGIPGNLFTIMVILSSSKMRQKSFNILIVNQSILDCLVCTTSVLLIYIDSMDVAFSDFQRYFLCHFWLSTYVLWALTACSSYNLTAISLERHHAIWKPFVQSEEKVRSRLPLILFSVWFCGFAAVFPDAMSKVSENECVIYGSVPATLVVPFTVWSMVSTSIFPAFTMLFSYIHMGILLREGSLSVQRETSTNAGILSQVNT